MTKNTLREYCLRRKAAAEDTPFGEDTLVFRVMGKIFALMGIDTPDDQPARINLKCDPNLAIILRQTYSAVIPGYH
ncbi:MAG: MmcQ/YjbR family DNA-binding protein, partial [Chitinophagaceae bacterium]|nr:MmcQ/YjbR family DNA-binding protein [Anaerolineae bacterium]